MQLLCCSAVTAAAAHAVHLTEWVGLGYSIMYFRLVRHRTPRPRLMCYSRGSLGRACCATVAAPAAVLPLPWCCWYARATTVLICCCSCFVCDNFFLLIPVRAVLLCKSPPLGEVSPHHEVKKRTHLFRKQYEYRLVIGICLASRRMSRACVVFVRYVPVRYAAAEFVAPT